MVKKYYVVWKGRKIGIFTSWLECKAQVEHFSGAKYKSFSTKTEAELAFSTTHSFNVIKSKSTENKKVKNHLSNEKIKVMLYDLKIFSDGACEPNPGEAGSGIAIYKGNVLSELWYGMYNSNGTNNSAELQALYQSLLIAKKSLKENQSIAIYSDSNYSIQCITKWAVNWEKKGWTKSGGEIKNLELIQKMFKLYQIMKDSIDIYHVNGHVGIEGNELADRMSIIAVEHQEKNFILYDEKIDINKILASRRG